MHACTFDVNLHLYDTDRYRYRIEDLHNLSFTFGVYQKKDKTS